jgi:hypothetical protein
MRFPTTRRRTWGIDSCDYIVLLPCDKNTYRVALRSAPHRWSAKSFRSLDRACEAALAAHATGVFVDDGNY